MAGIWSSGAGKPFGLTLGGRRFSSQKGYILAYGPLAGSVGDGLKSNIPYPVLCDSSTFLIVHDESIYYHILYPILSYSYWLF